VQLEFPRIVSVKGGFPAADGGLDMPLQKGRSNKTISANIEKLAHEYEATGRIGTSHPASKKKAIKQAVAISLSKAGRSRVRASVESGH
jgi:hypothetical protein